MKFRVKAFILAVVVSMSFIVTKNIYSCRLSAQLDKGIYRASELGSVDRLYIGSSMFRRGIDINEAVKLSDSSFLLEYSGFDPMNERHAIDFLIQSGLEIKNLYFDMYAYSAARESWLAEPRMFFDSPVSLKLNIADSIMHNSRANVISSLWELFMYSGNDMFISWPLYRRLTARLYYKGGAPDGGYSPGTTRERLARIGVNKVVTQRMNQEQKAALISIINACQKNDINLTFVETPKYYKTVEDKNYQSLMLEYFALLKDHDVKCVVSSELLDALNMKPNHIIRSYIFPHDDPEMFGDQIHLSSLGSRTFTSILCEEI